MSTGGGGLIRPWRFEEGGEAGVAGVVERGRAQREARQRVGEGAPVELVVELGAALDEQREALVGVVDQILDAPLDRVEEAAEAGIVERGVVGDEDQLVVGRDALLLGIEGAPGSALERRAG